MPLQYPYHQKNSSTFLPLPVLANLVTLQTKSRKGYNHDNPVTPSRTPRLLYWEHYASCLCTQTGKMPVLPVTHAPVPPNGRLSSHCVLLASALILNKDCGSAVFVELMARWDSFAPPFACDKA